MSAEAKRIDTSFNSMMLMRMFNLGSSNGHLATKRDQMDRLLQLLRDDDEIEVVISLLERASCYRGNENDAAAAALAAHIQTEWSLNPGDTCFLAKDLEESHTGSADAALEFVRKALFELASSWKGSNFLGSKTPLLDGAKWKNLVLVDDFVGSGKKLQKKIKWLSEHTKETPKVYVATFVAHELAFELLDPLTESFHATKYLQRGISDHYADEATVGRYIDAMLRIEGRFGTINPKFSLGFDKTESTYFPFQWNTPNNVFPIFWTVEHKQDTQFAPILVRMPKA